MNKPKWKCSTCKALKKNPVSPLLLPDNAASQANVTAALTSIMNIDSDKLFAYMDKKFTSFEATMLKTIADLKASVKFISDNYDSVKKGMEGQAKELKTLQTENVALKNAVKLLETKVDNLEEDCSKRDQWSRMQNIELVGVPECDNESLPDIVLKVAAYTGVPLQRGEVDFAHRVQARRPVKGTPRAIVVQFRDRTTKDALIYASRQCPGRMTTRDLGMDGEPHKVHVNEHLTVKNKILFSKTKKVAHDKGYKFTWTKNCRVYIRKSEGSPYILISKDSDLEKIE